MFSSEEDARSYNDSQAHCEMLHPSANLVSIETDEEKDYLASLLSREGSEKIPGLILNFNLSDNLRHNQPICVGRNQLVRRSRSLKRLIL